MSAQDIPIDAFQLKRIESHKTVYYKTQQSKYPQIILIKNYTIDTYAQTKIAESNQYYASWMGSNGFYFVFIPENTAQLSIKINTLDSENQVSKIGTRRLLLKNLNEELINAFKNHSDATILRYKQYIGGADQRALALSKYYYAKSVFKKYDYNFFSALSSFEASIILFEQSKYKSSISELQYTSNNWLQKNLTIQKLKALNIQGLAFWKLNKLEEAINIFNQIINNNKSIQSTQVVPNALNNLGLIYWDKGNYIRAKLNFHSALTYYGILFDENKYNKIQNITKQRVKNLKQVAGIFNNLALVYDSLGNTDIAMELWMLYLELAHSLSDKNTLAKAENNIALLLLQNGNYEKSKTLLNDAILIFKKNNNHRWLSLAQHNLGQVYLKLGLFKLAEIQFSKAMKLRDAKNNPKGLLETQLKLLDLYRNQGKYLANKKLSIETLELAKKINHPKALALIYLNDFYISVLNKNYNQAEIKINKALKVAKNKTYKRVLSKIKIHKAELLLLQNKILPAIKILRTETLSLKKIWDTSLLNKANNLLAKAYLQSKQLADAKITIMDEIDNLEFYLASSNNNKIRENLSHMLKETLSIYNTVSLLQNKSMDGFILYSPLSRPIFTFF